MNVDAEPAPSDSRTPRRWQFSLRSLLRWTLYVSVGLGLFKLFGIFGGLIFACFYVLPLLLCLRGKRPELSMMKCCIGYFAVSMLTLPFIDKLWLGEIPLLTVFQWPKTEIANWLRELIVWHMIMPLGLSRGSMSPDWTAARPYALAVTYAVPLGIFLLVVWLRTRMVRPYVWWASALVLIAIGDFCLVLALAGGPGLSIY